MLRNAPKGHLVPNAEIFSRAKQPIEGGRATYMVFAVTFVQKGFATQTTLEITSAGKAKIRDNPVQNVLPKRSEKNILINFNTDRYCQHPSFLFVKTLKSRPVRYALSWQRLLCHVRYLIIQTVVIAKADDPLVIH